MSPSPSTAYTGLEPVAEPTKALRMSKMLPGKWGSPGTTSFVATITSRGCCPSSSASAGEVTISAPGAPGVDSFTGNPGSESPLPSQA